MLAKRSFHATLNDTATTDSNSESLWHIRVKNEIFVIKNNSKIHILIGKYF